MDSAGTPKESGGDEARRRAEETKRLESLRERLYARGTGGETALRHDLRATVPQEAPRVAPPPPLTASTPVPMTVSKTRRSMRRVLGILGLVFFVGALIVSSAFLFMGQNSVSGNNISIDVNGPLAVGGGETMNLDIAIANQNTLPIESATLIITYPRGAQSTIEQGKELFTERQQLNNIKPNEVVNVPLRFVVFGEEGDAKNVDVSVEYRVSGSNATFYKEALPFEFKVSSSPVVLNINSVKRISSGQETTIELVVQSNSPEDLNDLLVKASYPPGFEFKESSPETASGEDTWKIQSIKPGEESKITLTGVMTGSENEAGAFEFTIGVPNERDAFAIASTLAVRETEIVIERPFLDVEVSINAQTGETVIVEPGSPAGVTIAFKNALETTVYDGVIQVELGGNALNEVSVRTDDGNYDSTTNILTWDSIAVDGLRELAPGERKVVDFSVEPKRDIRENPEIELTVTIQGNRVGEDRVPEQVVGTIARTIKVASVPNITSSALYTEGPFNNSGPVPPVAERTTEYTLLLAIKNGTNPVTGGEVTASMPAYMAWLDRSSDDDAVVYNAANRTLTWEVGELKANEYKEVWVQVALKPSLSQVGLIPTILESQRFRATDRFTGTSVRDEAPALTTSLTNDPNRELRDGRVLEN